MTKLFLTSIIFLIGSTASLNSGVAGKWKTTIDTDNGPFSFTVDYKVDGEALSGTFSSEFGDLDFSGGKITGNEFEYTYYMAEYKMNHKGKLEGDKIVVTWIGEGLGEGKFTLTRVDQ